MSNVSGIGTAGLQNIPSLDRGDQYLSGDALIMQLESQMQSLDGDIKMYAGIQKAYIARKKALEDAYHAGTKHDPPKSQADWDENIQGMYAAANELPPDDPERQKIYDQIDAIQHQYCNGLSQNPHYPADSHEWENSIQSFKDETENINGNAELNMIKIQDLMSKRQTAIQLTTGILQKMDQTAEGIVQKI